jgi:hypothetical protein
MAAVMAGMSFASPKWHPQSRNRQMPHRRVRSRGRLRRDVDAVLRVSSLEGVVVSHCRDVTLDGFEIETSAPVGAGTLGSFIFEMQDVAPLSVSARCVNCRAAARGHSAFVSAWEFAVRTDEMATQIAGFVATLQPYRVMSSE